MEKSWFEKLEENLDNRLAEFLQANPSQDKLLKNQSQTDLYNSLILRQEQLKLEAQTTRKELLHLAEDIQDWRRKSAIANQAGRSDLGKKASYHLNQLMEHGRNLWSKLIRLGVEIKAMNNQINEISLLKKEPISSHTDEWAAFETEEELELLRQKIGLND